MRLILYTLQLGTPARRLKQSQRRLGNIPNTIVDLNTVIIAAVVEGSSKLSNARYLIYTKQKKGERKEEMLNDCTLGLHCNGQLVKYR